MTTKQINASLQIVKLKKQKFRTTNGYYQPEGYTLYHPDLGYITLDNDDYPYIPCGGKKALQEILNAGGLLDYTNVKWLQPMQG